MNNVIPFPGGEPAKSRALEDLDLGFASEQDQIRSTSVEIVVSQYADLYAGEYDPQTRVDLFTEIKLYEQYDKVLYEAIVKRFIEIGMKVDIQMNAERLEAAIYEHYLGSSNMRRVILEIVK